MPVSRSDALRLIAQEFPEDPVAFTCGATSREMADINRRENHLYVVDSMGLVSSIVLGLSLGLERDARRRVVGVEGDGGMLMNLNALTTIGYLQPKNLLLIVLDNQQYESTGGQHTFTTRLDLAAIASSCGLRTWQADDLEGLKQAIAEAVDTPGPGFIHMKIGTGHAPAPLLLDDPVTLGYRFTRWLRDNT
jgi:sulfopyruvate decarboxylase subunit beta